jgi:hypothetical protein
MVVLRRNFVAHYGNMPKTRKKGRKATAPASEDDGGGKRKYTIEDAVKMVRFSFLTTPVKFPS